MNDTFERVKFSIVEISGILEEDITLESEFKEDLNFDSVDSMMLIMVTEDEFDIDIPDSELTALKTVNDLVEVIDNQ